MRKHVQRSLWISLNRSILQLARIDSGDGIIDASHHFSKTASTLDLSLDGKLTRAVARRRFRQTGRTHCWYRSSCQLNLRFVELRSQGVPKLNVAREMKFALLSGHIRLSKRECDGAGIRRGSWSQQQMPRTWVQLGA